MQFGIAVPGSDIDVVDAMLDCHLYCSVRFGLRHLPEGCASD
jgi:hypothetical protein